jgi:hypothetical protein
MTIGANVAIMAAAASSARARQRVLDAFRVAGATAPDRARPLAELGLTLDPTLEACVHAGVVRRGKRDGELWLDESAYIARRDGGEKKAVKVVVIAMLAGLGLLLLALLLVSRRLDS